MCTGLVTNSKVVSHPSATDLDGDEDDDRQTYIVTATEAKIWDAIVAVNGWIGDRPQGEYAADGFQKALAFPPRKPDGGAHDADEADEADADEADEE